MTPSALNSTQNVACSKGKNPAARIHAIQEAAIADVMAQHKDVLTRYLPNYGWSDTGFAEDPALIQLFDADAITARIQEVRKADQTVLQAELKKAEALGPTRTLAKPPCPAALKDLRRDFPHFTQVLDLVDRCVSLAHVTPGQVFSLPPILLAGDPGVGKTAFAEALAKTLVQPLKRVDIASTSAGFVLSGNHESWSGAKHGAIWSLLQAEGASGVLLLEEIDKASRGNYPALGSLYSLLEPVSACHFKDEFIQVEVDASHLIVMATCNEPDNLERALKSRFTHFHIPMPNRHQMQAITRSVYRYLRSTKRWGPVFDKELDEGVVQRLSVHTPRQLTHILEGAVCRAADGGRTHIQVDDLDQDTQEAALDSAPFKFGFV